VRPRHRPEPVASPSSPDPAAASRDLFSAIEAEPRSDHRSGKLRAVSSELRFGQLGIAQLALRTLDPAQIWAELDARVKAAPQLFTLAPLVLDLGQLPELPDADALRRLLAAIREAGLLPVGVAHGSADSDALARALDLPLFAKLRDVPAKAEPAPMPAAAMPAATPATAPKSTATTAPLHPAGLHHAEPVRSGQQVYARDRDLTLTAMVGNGAEVIADGSIHVYGTLRGRALAGAQGDAGARIYCQNFQAELISIAGQYRVFEDIPAALRGKPVQAWLEDDKLKLAALT
jgi:septum site-determining protein MinC